MRALLWCLSGWMLGATPVPVACPEGSSVRGALPPQGFEQWCVRQTDDGGLVRHGPLRAWHPDGSVRAEAEFCSETRCGRLAEWYSNGKPKTLGELDALGRRQGRWMEWGTDGAIVADATYLDDAIIPKKSSTVSAPQEAPYVQRYFPPPLSVAPRPAPPVPDGPVAPVVAYPPLSCPKGAVLAGEAFPRGLVQWCQMLDPSGKWIRHGILREWYPNGQRRSESDYVRGRTTGWVTRWFPNGLKAEETRYRYGVPDGKSTQWAEDGHRIRREVYERGKLVSVERGTARLLPTPP
ncbi:MAG: toxin-antitoxin system YwqK family antitoxin [Myxococcaceae bacterium]